MKRGRVAAELLAVLALLLVFVAPQSLARVAAATTCNRLAFFGFAGSGELDDPSNAQQTGQMGPEIQNLYQSLQSKYGNDGVSMGGGGVAYPAISVQWWHISYYLYDYNASVNTGVANALQAIGDAYTSCGGSQEYILAGYSQGADVVVQTLSRLPAAMLKQVSAVALFGDPRFRPGVTPLDQGTWTQRPKGHGILASTTTLPGVPARSYCLYKDPMCNNTTGQAQAAPCAVDCPHLHYISSGLTSVAANWVHGAAPTTLHSVGEAAANPQAYIDEYNSGGGYSAFGPALNAVHAWGPGCIQDFSGGTAGRTGIMSQGCGGAAYRVQGDQWAWFEGRYGSDASNVMGYPIDDVHRWGNGWTQDFDTGQLGHNLLMKADNASQLFDVFGGIRDYYLSQSGATGRFGYPTSDEYGWNGVTRRDFQGGSIIFLPQQGTTQELFSIGQGASNQQAFIDEFNRDGGYAGMGFPADAVHVWANGCTQDLVGGYNTKSAIMSYGCAGTAYDVVGEQWRYLEGNFGGNAAAVVGYPTNDVHRWGNGWTQDFYNGQRSWNLLMKGDNVGSVHDVLGGIRDRYLSEGGATGWLGYPTSDEYNWNDYIRQDFEGGSVLWNSNDGAKILGTDLTIVDDPNISGPAGPARRTGIGYDGDMWTTGAEGASNPAVNSANWIGNITSGRYRIDVYVPHNYATANVSYYVRWNGGQTQLRVNQYNFNDQWVTLGTFDINGPQASVGSNDAADPRGAIVGWDAIRWVKVG